MHRNHQSMRIGLPQIALALCAVICPHACAQGPPRPAVPPGALPQPSVQGNGDITFMPQSLPLSRRSGLRVSVDTRWVNAYGYRPVEVTISSPQPTTAAHTIKIKLHSGWSSVTTAEQDFEFPSGATSATTIVSVPCYEQQSVFAFWWNVRVDGVDDIDLSLDQESASRRVVGSNVSAFTIRVLVDGSQTTQKLLVSTNISDFEVLSLVLSDFPRRWIDYTCLDVVSISTSNLEQLAKTNPAALEAVKRWVRTGGQLWVSDAGAKLEKLPEISKQLTVPDGLKRAVADAGVKDPSEKAKEKGEAGSEQLGDHPAEVGWRPGRFRGGARGGRAQGFSDLRTRSSRWVTDPSVIAQLEQDPNFVRTNEAPTPDDPNVEGRLPPDTSEWFVEQRLGLGTLRVFRGANEAALFAQSIPTMNANATANSNGETGVQLPPALSLGLRTTRHWDARHGLIPDSGNPEFAKLLVPGVGLAPVTEFQALITLFVLLIGPFNYWVLKRYKRLQLLVLTVPLAAGVATLALFAYAVVSDGFATKVRVRSYTTIDQPTGEAACWAWMSYYAGLAPGQGLTMPADAAVYPILPNWGSEDLGTKRAMIWDGNQAMLTRGWLNSRTPTQYLMVRSRKTPHRVDVTSGNGKMQIVNRLGTRIESLLVLDESGKFFSGDGLASESRVLLAPISRDDAVKRIVQLVRDNEPEMPAALSGSDRDFSGGGGRSMGRSFGRYRPPSGESHLNENLAGRAISDLAGMNGRPALDLPARSYVAVTSNGPEVDSGISYANEEASFHVIVGHW
jgi:hypothetical protein